MNQSFGQSAKSYAILPFYATAAVSFILLTILMLIASTQFVGHYFQGRTLALVHTAALGWATMIIFGAGYQLLPVIFENKLFSSELAFTSYLFLLTGTLLLVPSFWFFTTGWAMISGGILITLATVIYNINVFTTARWTKGMKTENLFIVSSALYLFITAGVGLLLTINLKHPFFSKSHLEILKIHAHLGLAGWFLQLITGVSARLIPMFLLSKSNKPLLLRASFILQNVALVAFAIDRYFASNITRTALYIVIMTIGILCWVLYVRDIFKNRIKKKTEMQMRFTFLSFGFLLAALPIALLILYTSTAQWSILYGTYLLLGWVSALIMGMTFKTLPFIIWNIKYKSLHGKAKLPMPKDLYIEKWIQYQFWLFIAAMLSLTTGIMFRQMIFINTGLLLWLLIAVLYIVNVTKVLFHKTKINYDTTDN